MKKLLFPLAALLLAVAPIGARAQSTPPTVPTWAETHGVGSSDESGQPRRPRELMNRPESN